MTIQKLFLSAVVALAVGAAVAAFGGSGKVLSLLTQAVIYAVFAIGVGLLLRQNRIVGEQRDRSRSAAGSRAAASHCAAGAGATHWPSRAG